MKNSRFSIFSSLVLASMVVMLRAPSAFGFIELNAFYFSEVDALAASTNTTRTFLEGAIGFRIDKPGQYLVGWGYASHSDSSSGSTTTTYSSTQMGPRFLWFIDKRKTWSFGFAYYIVTSASYTAAGSSETWKGTALHADLGYNLPIDDNSFFAIRLNYSSSSYSEKLVGGTTYSTIGYTKTYIYPSLAVGYVW